MDRFDSLQLFVRIVDLGSFTRAAGALGIPRATATYALKALEARLGTRLLERTTRHVRPTLEGQAFYERCVHLLAELEDTEASLRTAARSPRGTLRLDLHGTHATHVVLPRIDEFRRQYPQIDLVVSHGDRLVDLVREGIDCVVRAGTPQDSSLVARKLAVLPEVLCASPAYLERFGTPTRPADLVHHQAVGFFSTNHDRRYPIEFIVDGNVEAFDLDGWIAVSDAEAYVVSALSGCGLIQLPRHHVDDALADGRLVELLADWKSPGVVISAMYPHHRESSPRVRAFVDWVAVVYRDKFGPTQG